MMFCKSCRAFPSLAKGNNLFVGVGGGKIRIKTLQEHSKTTSHSTAQALRLRNLVELHHKNGLDLGDTYKNDNACRTFVQAIGQSMKDDLVEKLKNTHFFSVMSDSSVDRSHAHSQGILDAILVGLRNVGLTEQDLKSRMVGFGCDGASLMMGVHNGVAAKLKQMCPSIVPIWCVAHRLELSALDSIKSVPLLAELKETLNGVYKHYSHSAKLPYKMVMFIHLVLDILQELKQLSLLFQRDGLTLQMVSDGLQTTTLSLVAMQTDPGPRLQKVLDEHALGIWRQGF
ncbi:Zinc finger protein 862 [Dissostichus eleginoides]|uniref:Zinc finger protein 862 n=1 Tax=Dissostichus eleginoides TaxID=100907 RepID=A0AAD9F7E3_DISEL|nr:Zinc finger protein 862 [Dissostichus eleginoides]